MAAFTRPWATRCSRIGPLPNIYIYTHTHTHTQLGLSFLKLFIFLSNKIEMNVIFELVNIGKISLSIYFQNI